MEGSRPRGGPKRIWREVVQKDCLAAGEQVTLYLTEIQHSALSTPVLAYWELKFASLLLLAPFAEDIMFAPASHEYVEQIFSLFGILCSGRHSQIRKCCKLDSN